MMFSLSEVKTSFFSSATKVDYFLQQYKYSEILNNIKKSISDYNYTPWGKIIENISKVIKEENPNIKFIDF